MPQNTWSKWIRRLRRMCWEPRSRLQLRTGSSRHPALEYLEERVVPATTRYVDNPALGNAITAGVSGDFQVTHDQGTIGTLDAGDEVTWNPGLNSAHGGPVAGLIFGTTAFGTIQSAINASVDGDTVRVAGGTFSELVNVNKSIDVLGNQFGVDARTRTGLPESIVDGATNIVGSDTLRTTAFYITASNASV